MAASAEPMVSLGFVEIAERAALVATDAAAAIVVELAAGVQEHS